MTKEDIIRMAHEVFDVQTDSRERTTFSGDSYAIEAFATLVASAEREECKKLCTWKTGNQFVDEAVAVCYRAIDQRGQE